MWLSGCFSDLICLFAAVEGSGFKNLQRIQNAPGIFFSAAVTIEPSPL